MTSTLSPADTGEIRTGARDPHKTQNLFPYTADLPPVLRRPDATVVLTVVDGLMPPQPGQPQPQLPPMPHPVPPPAPYLDRADAQPIAPLERVAGADDTAVISLRKSALFVMPTKGRRVRQGRHRRPVPLWTGIAIGYGSAVASAAVVVAALLAVR